MSEAVSVMTKENANLVPVSIVGARGYSGLELARLLLRHPKAKLTSAFATGKFRLADYLPEKAAAQVAGRGTDELLTSIKDEGTKIVFLATPAETSIELAPELLAAGVSVIDLSGAFRLSRGTEAERLSQYKEWYGFDHHAANLLASAEFGLVPWVQAAPKSQGPRLIANPGCFSTATLMAILPLVKAGLIDVSTLVVDAKSGTTGAGKKAEERLLHAEVDGLCLPYRIGRHQHEPEIVQTVKNFTGKDIEMFFTTHLLNVRRGIIASVYAKLNETLTGQPEETLYAEFKKAFSSAYGEDPLVDVKALTESGSESLLNLRRVVGSPRTQIAFKLRGQNVYAFSLIDNLMKGAASQAVENFNRVLGVPTWTGLSQVEGLL